MIFCQILSIKSLSKCTEINNNNNNKLYLHDHNKVLQYLQKLLETNH